MAPDVQLGDDKLPVEVGAERKEPGPEDGSGGQHDYSVERVEQVYR
jgi:hypothetical protein